MSTEDPKHQERCHEIQNQNKIKKYKKYLRSNSKLPTSYFDWVDLTTKQENFIHYYVATGGNSTDAAKLAGYSEKTAKAKGHELMTNPKIKRRILARLEEERARVSAIEIASKEERQQLYTRLMFDPKVLPRDRLRASELLGRTQGDFITQIEVDYSDIDRQEVEDMLGLSPKDDNYFSTTDYKKQLPEPKEVPVIPEE